MLAIYNSYTDTWYIVYFPFSCCIFILEFKFNVYFSLKRYYNHPLNFNIESSVSDIKRIQGQHWKAISVGNKIIYQICKCPSAHYNITAHTSKTNHASQWRLKPALYWATNRFKTECHYVTLGCSYCSYHMFFIPCICYWATPVIKHGSLNSSKFSMLLSIYYVNKEH